MIKNLAGTIRLVEKSLRLVDIYFEDSTLRIDQLFIFGCFFKTDEAPDISF
jgi:hypothetical protein